jgi:hypothetical protein
MQPRTLFLIILKCLGIYLLKDTIEIAFQLISYLVYYFKGDNTGLDLQTLIFSAAFLALYIFICNILLFKTNWLITFLRLDKGFSEEKLDLNISMTTVLNIVLIITAALMLITEIPNFCKLIYEYFSKKEGLIDSFARPAAVLPIISGAKILIAFLLIGERQRIIDFFMLRKWERTDDMEEEEENLNDQKIDNE